MTQITKPRGGMFLFEQGDPAAIATPESLTEDQDAMRRECRRFVTDRIVSDPVALETHDGEPHVPLMKELGSLGFLGVDVPEEWGGLGMGAVTATAVLDEMAQSGSGSFTTTYSAHIGIGTWPVQFFGTDAQREKYLRRLVSGELLGAYAITEPHAGSDVLAGNTTAERQEDGTWLLNGGKIFITNAAFADLFTVYAKVGGEHACFLVERDTPGFSIGKEEHKLGIRGSSTRPITFEDVRLPEDALLGEVGKGHHVILNTLNLGRFKLAPGSVGGMKQSLKSATTRALERQQFGKRIAEFGAVRQMLVRTAVDCFVAESMAYRTAGLLDDALEGVPPGTASAKAIQSCSIECSLVKFRCSDMLYWARDREVQVYGGEGFIEEYSPARALRDARIFRIFEGTNEINALHAAAELLKRAAKMELPLFTANGPSLDEEMPELYAITVMKKAIIRSAKAAAMKWQQGIVKEQEVLVDLAHAMADLYGLESARLRIDRMGPNHTRRPIADRVAGSYFAAIIGEFSRRIGRIDAAVGHASNAKLPELVRRALAHDVIADERAIAKAIVDAEGYPF